MHTHDAVGAGAGTPGEPDPLASPPPFRWSAKAVATLLACALGYAALQTTQVIVVIRTRTPLPYSAPDIFRENLTRALAWAALTPLVFWVGARVRLAASGVLTGALLLGLSVIVALAHEVIMAFAGVYVSRLAAGPVSLQLDYLLRSYFLGEWVLFWLILGAYYLIDYPRRVRESSVATARLATRAARLEASVSEARLRALQMELDPHFLFNILHAIGSLVRQGQDQRAVQVISKLGAMLRRGLARDSGSEVPLGEEVAAISEYLELEQLRFGGDLRVEIDVDPSLAPMVVPVSILQPLVENAARHGLRGVTGTRRILVEAKALRDELLLSVSDSGVGFSEDAAEGVGLSNIRSRLTSLYGLDAGVTIRRSPLGGAGVEVRIPLRPHPGSASSAEPA